jgi:hypothetical protein
MLAAWLLIPSVHPSTLLLAFTLVFSEYPLPPEGRGGGKRIRVQTRISCMMNAG